MSNFYTSELMSANGWEADSSTACAGATATGATGSGAFCGFKKTENGTEKILGIIATQEDTSKPTGVFFLRLETSGDGPVASRDFRSLQDFGSLVT